MLTFGLFPNLKKPEVDKVVAWLINLFSERNIQVLMPEDAAGELGFPELGRPREQLGEAIQLGITLGGDGTIINAAREMAPAGVPICGINMGQLGFLTEIERAELVPAIDKLVAGDYYVEERLMLDAFIRREGKDQFVCSAVNDVVVTKGGFSRLIRVQLYIDDELAARYPADGLIIATSTGSTGYSLSAGGPIINPALKVIVLTPICPHTLHARSLVVSETQEIKATMQATHDDIVLTVDGQTLFNLQPSDVLVVRRSPLRARFARFSGHSFPQTVRTKLWRGLDDDAG